MYLDMTGVKDVEGMKDMTGVKDMTGAEDMKNDVRKEVTNTGNIND